MRSVRGCTLASSAAMLMKYRGRCRSPRRLTSPPPCRPERPAPDGASPSDALLPLVECLRGSKSLALRTIAGRRGHRHRLRRTSLDLDLPGLDVIRLRDVKGQDAVVEDRVRLLALDVNRELQLAVEGAVSAFAVEVLVPLDFLVSLELAADLQRLAGQGDLDILWLDARQGRADDDLIGGLMHVERRCQRRVALDRPPCQR